MNNVWEQTIQSIKGVGEARAKLFRALGVETVGDLLTFFPRDYEDRTVCNPIFSCQPEEWTCIKALVGVAPTFVRTAKGLSLSSCTVYDQSGKMELVWFNQPHLSLQPGQEYVFYGKVSLKGRKKQMVAPIFESAEKEGVFTRALVPKYHLTARLSHRICTQTVRECLRLVHNTLPDLFSPAFRQEHSLCEINYAIEQIHFPKNTHALDMARRRLAFEELFLLSLGLQLLRGVRQTMAQKPFLHCEAVWPFISTLPFSLTKAQTRVVSEILTDLSGKKVMNRLVQGDVGSGKTVVAACAIYAAFCSGFCSLFMAPTEVLAQQHFATCSAFFAKTNLRVALLTGGMSKKKKEQLLSEAAEGQWDLLIGTHALLEENVTIPRVGLVITDEQHRFGVHQRALLSQKGEGAVPMLVMTATPIPRTLALTLYGDLDVSVIDELPPGRQKILTYAVDRTFRERVYRFLKKQLDEGHQAYVICPLVNPSDKLEVAAVTALVKEVSETVLAGYRVGLLHGKSKQKAEVMEQFSKGEIQVLISTTVVEVGVNVPNATILIVENAERFGLSQLHQLRGRVGRGTTQSYCILFCETQGEVAQQRMQIMTKTNDGFVIAQKDMELRGVGDFFGTRQHGLPELKIANLFTDQALLMEARDAARTLLQQDPHLQSLDHFYLKKRMEQFFSQQKTGFTFN